MGTMKIAIDAEVEGKSLEFKFTWDGGDEEIDRVMDFVEKRADEAGVDPATLTSGYLHHLPRLIDDDPEKNQFLMMILLDLVLRMPVPDHPDVCVCDIAAEQDVAADMIVRDNKLRVEFRGQPRAN